MFFLFFFKPLAAWEKQTVKLLTNLGLKQEMNSALFAH